MNNFADQKSLQAYQIQQIIKQSPQKITSKCMHSLLKMAYHLQTYIFDTISPMIRQKMNDEIEAMSYIQIAGLSNIHQSFMYSAQGKTRLALASKYITAKPLKIIMNSDKGFTPDIQPIQMASQLATILTHLHQKRLVHDNLQLSNIFWKKTKKLMILGHSRVHQIQKCLKYPLSAQKWIWMAPERSIGVTASAASDVWQLGAVLLQMTLCEDLEQKCKNSREQIHNKISKVQNVNLQDLLKRILINNPTKRPSAAQIISLITKLKNNQYTPIQIGTPIRPFRTIQLDIFLQKPAIVVSQETLNEQETVQICNSIKCTFRQMGKYILATISPQENRKQICVQLIIPRPLQKQLIHLAVSQPKDILVRFTRAGTLLISLPIEPEPIHRSIEVEKKVNSSQWYPIVWNGQYMMNNMGLIKTNRSSTKGFLIATGIVLFPLPTIMNQTEKEPKNLSFISQTNFPFSKLGFNCPSDYKTDKSNLHNCYGLMHIMGNVVGSCNFFKQLLKNYSEEVIDHLADSSSVHYNYQLGDRPLRKGQVEFDQQHHLFFVKDNHAPPGQPLTLNFSNNTYAIIGLHIGGGKGITFDEVFFSRVFEWIGSSEMISIVSDANLDFAIVDCSKFVIQKCQIVCLANTTRISFLKFSQPGVNAMKMQIEREMRKGESPQLGIKLFDYYISQMDANDIVAAKETCQKAEEVFKKIYKLPVCSLVINFNLANSIIGNSTRRNGGSVGQFQRNLAFELLKKCINILEEQNISPLMLAHCYQRAAVFRFDYNQSIPLHMKSISLCHRLHHRRLLSDNHTRMIKDYKLPDAEVERIYAQQEKALFGSALGDSPEMRLEHLKQKIQFLKEPKRFKMINKCLRELMELTSIHFQDDELKQKQAKEIWKSFLVQIMAQNPLALDVLQQFENLLKKYEEDAYVHLKEAFRKKQNMIKNQNKSIGSLFGGLGYSLK